MDGDEDIVDRRIAELAFVAAASPEESTIRPDASGFELRLNHRSVDHDHAAVLVVDLPKEYPVVGTPVVQLCAKHLTREKHQQLSSQLVSAAESREEDTECLLELIQVAKDGFDAAQEAVVEASTVAVADEPAAAAVMCTVIRFDHIKARMARKIIVEQALSNGLTGVVRPGKPGFILACGPRQSTRRYFEDLKSSLGTCTRNMGCWG